MAWALLILAGLTEIVWSVSLKLMGFSSPKALLWLGVNVATLLVLTLCMNRATQSIPIGTAYAIFTGIGAMGSVAVGIYVFKEPATAARLFFVGLLLTSIIGLKITTPTLGAPASTAEAPPSISPKN